MKIKDIDREDNIFTVTFTPNWLEKLFNIKDKIKQYKYTGRTYRYGGNVYVNKDGEKLGLHSSIGAKLDNYTRAF